jgi:hypothetical protein
MYSDTLKRPMTRLSTGSVKLLVAVAENQGKQVALCLCQRGQAVHYFLDVGVELVIIARVRCNRGAASWRSCPG